MNEYALALVLVYLLAGVAATIAVAAARRRVGLAATRDLPLVMLLWPLCAPMALNPAAPEGPQDRESTLLAALRRVQGTPLAALLPERGVVKVLCRNLRQSSARLAEIDAVLRRPEMAEEPALDRLATVEEGERRSAALLRLQGIRRLRSTREQVARRLREIDDLLDQLAAQAQIVRFLGNGDAPGGDLVRELVTRVEALGQLLDDGDRA